MPSAFKKVVKSVIREVGGGSRGDLIPVDCLRNSASFRPYCLLSRKPSSSWFWKPRYTCVNLSIKDILEPNTPEPEPQCSGHFQVSDVVDGSVEGSVTLSGTGEGKISGGAAVSDSSSASMNVRILLVTQNTWETMQRDREAPEEGKSINTRGLGRMLRLGCQDCVYPEDQDIEEEPKSLWNLAELLVAMERQ